MCKSPSIVAKAPSRDCPGVLTEYIQQEPSTDTGDPCNNMAKLKQIKNHLAHATLPLQFRTRLLNSKPASTCARNTTTINEQSSYPTMLLASEEKHVPLQPPSSHVRCGWYPKPTSTRRSLRDHSKHKTTGSRTKLARYFREGKPGRAILILEV